MARSRPAKTNDVIVRLLGVARTVSRLCANRNDTSSICRSNHHHTARQLGAYCMTCSWAQISTRPNDLHRNRPFKALRHTTANESPFAAHTCSCITCAELTIRYAYSHQQYVRRIVVMLSYTSQLAGKSDSSSCGAPVIRPRAALFPYQICGSQTCHPCYLPSASVWQYCPPTGVMHHSNLHPTG